MGRVLIPENLKPGLKGEAHTVVCEHNLAGHVGTFATAYLVKLMEAAAANAVRPHMGPLHTSVGYHVDVYHTAPTLIGRPVRATAELVEIKGNKLLFRVEACDDKKRVGHGTHSRAVVTRDFGKGERPTVGP